MNDQEWMKWGHRLDCLISNLSHLTDDLEELRGLADGLQQVDSEGDEALGRFSPTDWTWHMGGDWNEPLSALETHLEGFDPKDFKDYLARRASANGAERGP